MAHSESLKTLEEVARSVNWYTEPERVLANRPQFLCEVMARGMLEDILAVRAHHTWDEFRQAYRSAPPGLFTPQAWAYWGLMLLNDPDRPMPQRFPDAPPSTGAARGPCSTGAVSIAAALAQLRR